MEPLINGNIRLAATILLVRDGPGGPEVFMTQRPGGVVFPDLHVFPGGKVDAQDLLPAWVEGLDDMRASALLGVPAGGMRYWAAAIRECFEECGVLLAYRDGEPLRWSGAAEARRFTDYRQQLIDGALSLAALCERERLQLAADRVQYFSHWVTPAEVPRRFDTRFFIAAMPAHQQTLAHAREIVADEWVRPEDALAAHREGRWQMISPTLVTLQAIAGFPTTATLLAAVAREAHLQVLSDELRRQGMSSLR